MKITYKELIEKYPFLSGRISEKEWIEIFDETIDETFEIFYLEK